MVKLINEILRRRSFAAPFRQIAHVFRAKGARVTPARLRLIVWLQSACTPLGHSEIEGSLADEAQPHIDRVTVCRVLDWLVAFGFAHKAADARGIFRYSAAEPDREHSTHLHFRCTGCSNVICLDEPAPSIPSLPDGFRLARADVDIQGECARCAVGRP